MGHTNRYGLARVSFILTILFFRCPKDSTFRVVQKNQHILRFQIKVFDFLRKNKGIYLHCTSTLCKANSRHPICEFGCEHALSDRKSRRRFYHKEIVSNEIYTVSSGFIEVDSANDVEHIGEFLLLKFEILCLSESLRVV